jgi:hypothetical protein
MLPCQTNSTAGLTRIEVAVIVAATLFLAIFILPAVTKVPDRARRITCIGRLKQIGLCNRAWALDHTNSYAANLSTNLGGVREYVMNGQVFRYFQTMSNELNAPRILICPSDGRRSATDFVTLSNANISYFISLDAAEVFPNVFLAGDRNLTNAAPLSANGIMELTPDSQIGWTKGMHKGQGNIALSDGSVQSLSTFRVRDALKDTGFERNRLAMPRD